MRLYRLVNLIIAISAGWILLAIFLSFAAIQIWTPPYLIFFVLGGFMLKLALRMAVRRKYPR